MNALKISQLDALLLLKIEKKDYHAASSVCFLFSAISRLHQLSLSRSLTLNFPIVEFCPNRLLFAAQTEQKYLDAGKHNELLLNEALEEMRTLLTKLYFVIKYKIRIGKRLTFWSIHFQNKAHFCCWKYFASSNYILARICLKQIDFSFNTILYQPYCIRCYVL